MEWKCLNPKYFVSVLLSTSLQNSMQPTAPSRNNNYSAHQIFKLSGKQTCIAAWHKQQLINTFQMDPVNTLSNLIPLRAYQYNSTKHTCASQMNSSFGIFLSNILCKNITRNIYDTLIKHFILLHLITLKFMNVLIIKYYQASWHFLPQWAK